MHRWRQLYALLSCVLYVVFVHGLSDAAVILNVEGTKLPSTGPKITIETAFVHDAGIGPPSEFAQCAYWHNDTDRIISGIIIEFRYFSEDNKIIKRWSQYNYWLHVRPGERVAKPAFYIRKLGVLSDATNCSYLADASIDGPGQRAN